MKRRALISLSLFLLVYSGLVIYIGWNGWVWLQSVFQLENGLIYTAAITLAAFSYFISRVSSLSIFRIIGAYWLGIFQYALLLIPLANLAYAILSLFPLDQQMLLFSLGLIVITAVIAMIAYGSFQAYSPVIRPYQLHIAKKAENHKSLRIAVASDMHFGTLSGKAHARRLVSLIHQINPDLILLPGDIVDDDPDVFKKKKMGEELSRLNAPLGVYAVLGNHEYYGKKIPEFIEEMAECGVTVLLDETVEVDGSFYLLGRKDRTDHTRASVAELTQSLDQSKPVLMLDHQPYELEKAEKAGVDLLLSGHTHRGQLAPNHLFTKRLFEIDWGYHRRKTLHTIVSSGFGFWGPPLRIGSRSEIVQIDLTFESS
ncbi:metallophosphoesterase [Alkalihalobacillus oceani]|uniref:metallophosphoesterase n=1 Tax=Halalkalibacter oceani TaxID=1653776 RepID=UPI0020413635|nr:metallophosphoesterase [Halalkalibacter oceani]MCM3760183.1 metallophosphoesterase [Halalkalibacter oceani]